MLNLQVEHTTLRAEQNNFYSFTNFIDIDIVDTDHNREDKLLVVIKCGDCIYVTL